MYTIYMVLAVPKDSTLTQTTFDVSLTQLL